jgi:6-phosphogluconolactonase
LRTFFNDSAWPRFDLVLLGMGEDGHTASLFPETDVLSEEQSWVAAVWVEKFQAFRITLTAPAINHAAHILFLVTGENKAERLAEVFNHQEGNERLPVQLIHPANGSIEWLADRAAASRLRK